MDERLRAWTDLIGRAAPPVITPPAMAALPAPPSRAVPPAPAVIATGEALVRSWSEPHRRYHDLAHLDDVLARIDELEGSLRSGWTDPAEGAEGSPALVARLGAWYHDAIYDIGRADSEARSAERAVRELQALGVPASLTYEVSRIVLATTDHVVGPDDPAGALLCDADLAVLGRGPGGYARYVAAVRAEYGAFDDAAWQVGRGSALAALADRPQLFATEAGRARWEARARANLAAEQAALGAPGVG